MFFIIVKLNEYAAIAQSVERILGKDEVASSNLASSSMVYVDFTVFYYVETVISAILHKFYTDCSVRIL